MRGTWKVKGFVNKPSKMKMEQEDLIVNVTKDSLGCTVSIGSIDRDIQFSIPFDVMLKEINRR